MLLYIPYDSGVRKSCALPHNTAANNARIKVVLRISMVVFSLFRPRKYNFSSRLAILEFNN